MPPALGQSAYVTRQSTYSATTYWVLFHQRNTNFGSTFATGASQSEGQLSPFRRALDEYVQRKSKRSKTPAFLSGLQVPGSLQTKDDVQKAMVELEKTSTDKTSAKVVRKVLKPVIRVLADYTGIVDTLGMPFRSYYRIYRCWLTEEHSPGGSDAHCHNLGLSESCSGCKSPLVTSCLN